MLWGGISYDRLGLGKTMIVEGKGIHPK